MSWNEPGGGNKGPRDPWGGGNQGPPDLDEALKSYSSSSRTCSVAVAAAVTAKGLRKAG
jgi:hypothetical protein